MEASESLFKCLEQVADPSRARGSPSSFSDHTVADPAGPGVRVGHHGHIAPFANLHWPALKEPLGFVQDDPPHDTTIPRTLAGSLMPSCRVPWAGGWPGWWPTWRCRPRLTASGTKQSEDAHGNPLVMVNVLAHDLRLCLAQWLASEKRYEPGVLREQLCPLFERYPGLRLLSMDALNPKQIAARPQGSHADGGGLERHAFPLTLARDFNDGGSRRRRVRHLRLDALTWRKPLSRLR